ncbi:hypothetical protein [Alsobacter metallidurans]|uniref:hypothetical protein n=1 Tax=Alsobacter metallidurans TaxID=340221 RepID=UPI0016654ADD|nr:hypothetical protein [Alsobacter metallidurans]
MARIEATTPSSNCELLPVDACRAVLEAADRAMALPQPEEAAQLARTMIGVYPKADVTDPDVYATAVAGTLAEFPAHVARKVASPVHGLPSRQKFLPRIAEIREACEAEVARQKTIASRARWMIKERERREKEAAERASWEGRRIDPARVDAILAGIFKPDTKTATLPIEGA